jgi:heme oxygenase
MLRDALRNHTRIQHARLEKRLAIERRVRQRDAYVDLLERFYGFYVRIEPRLAVFAPAFEAHGIDLASRSKVAQLRRDLIALGERAAESESDLAPEISTFPQAVGCLYVLEGSTLGAQVILKSIRASSGLDAETGAAFLSGYGAKTGSMWRAFLEFLSELTFTPYEAEQAIAAARETFERLEEFLCDPSPELAVNA